MIHTFKAVGQPMLLDVGSGAVHAIDDMAFDVLEMWNDHTPEEIRDALKEKYTAQELDEVIGELKQLEELGALNAPDNYDDVKQVTEPGVVKSMCLHAAHDCNLRCKYCFAATGDFCMGERKLLPYEVGKAAIDWLVAHSGKRVNLELDFFGGEPLMNWQIVKDLVAYARSIEKDAGKNFRFTLTTNGVLLDDEVTDFCNREMHNVVLSLDGRKEVNDRFRVDVAGNGSYDRIVPNFQRFVAKRWDKSYYMRGTYTHYNTDFTNDLFHMADLGFTELSMEPVVCAPGDPCALTEEDFPVLCEQYEILAKDMLRRWREGKPITFYHYMVDLKHGPCIYKRVTGCGSGTEYMAVTPWGELFPCHQFVGDPKYSLGNIWDGVTNAAVQGEFRACNAYSRPDCKDCWARLYCSGGCAANSYHATGSIGGVYEYGCRLFKKRMECAIMLQAAMELESEG